MPEVSILVPVYGVEPWFGRCLRSLFGQTLDDVEYVFVDDCTPDASMAVLERVLEEYPHRKPQVRVLRHERNMGLAAARTTGLKAATGKYVVHCDSDDWVDTRMYETMYRAAEAQGADMVCCGYVSHHGDWAGTFNYPADYHDMCLRWDILFSAVWNKLVRRSLYTDHDILPFEGVEMCEDQGLTVRLRYVSRKTVVVPEALYHYNVRGDSICRDPVRLARNLDDTVRCAECLTRFFAERDPDGRMDLYLKAYQFTVARPFLDDRQVRDIARWRRTFPDMHKDIGRLGVLPRPALMLYRMPDWGMSRLGCLLLDIVLYIKRRFKR